MEEEETIYERAQDNSLETRMIDVLFPVLEDPNTERMDKEEEEEEREMNDQNTELAAKLHVSIVGKCYVCEEIGEVYGSIYLCYECNSKMEELVEKGTTVFCRVGCPKNCSSCLLSIVFQYLDVNNISTYEKIDYNSELMKEYVDGGSKDKSLEEKGADAHFAKYMDRCWDRYVQWIWEQKDIFQLNVDQVIVLLKANGNKGRYLTAIADQVGKGPAFKVDGGYINPNDIKSYKHRCLLITILKTATQMFDLKFTFYHLYLLKLVCLFKLDETASGACIAHPEATILAEEYSILLKKICKVEEQVVTVEEVMSLVQSLDKQLTIRDENSKTVERHIEALLEENRGKISFQPPRPLGNEGIPYRFINEGFAQCLLKTRKYLLNHFTVHDSRSLIQANIIKVVLFIRAMQDIPESSPYDDEIASELKNMIQNIKDTAYRMGLHEKNPIVPTQLVLLMDPGSGVKMRDCSQMYLSKVFLYKLSKVTKISVATFECLMPSFNLRGYLLSDRLCSQFVIYASFIQKILQAEAYVTQIGSKYLFDRQLLTSDWH
ncbi:uncharacterized protein LOC111636277 [Centruroides sculpturatus]|uniref:uncharacterized protein LOC111636277 n=1 Tax=Centruroides sculpturatus TaxID=218467 RepID=UPI000C6E9EFA|nr:uncharacterized protein LOC111636277 [Centruroides sculpturatus]